MEIRLTTGETIEAPEGESILQALRRHGIYLAASCGGKGVCGKCRVRVVEGEPGAASTGKLSAEEREEGMALACRSFPVSDLLLEIPDTSRLVVGDRIALSRTGELRGLLESMGATIKPLVRKIDLHLPPPTLHDNISDLERLRMALEETGLTGVRFSHGFMLSLAETLRSHEWKATLGYTAEPEAIFISPEDGLAGCGIAVDIGTTTVVVYLVDLSDGGLLDAGATYNSQARFGDDVITRIVHATEGGGMEELRRAVLSDINVLTETMLKKHGMDADRVESVVISGNTTMAHLFWGLNPGYIREEPYIPTINSFPLWKAGTARLRANPQSPVYTMPCVASYVGGDIVSGALVSRMHRNDELAVFMDIGTNGEIALGNNEWLVAAACSAGPCFEGSGIRHGMRATEGAIEAVTIDPVSREPKLTVIGGTRPVGICGSGMIDAVAEMFLTGLIDQKGGFLPEKAGDRLRQGEDGAEYVLSGEGASAVTLTEADIENILRAKAAIYAGVSLLLNETGFTEEDIQRVYIAGGFGNYLRVEQAIILGMLPDLPLDRFSFLGNTSVAGAYLSLLSEEMRAEAEEIASKMTYIELSASRGFMEEYISALFLPHTEINRFASVRKLMTGKS